MAIKKKKIADVSVKTIDELEAEVSSSGQESYQHGEFRNVPISVIAPNPNQPRQHFNSDSLEELKCSIEEKGVLQPIIIRQGENNASFYLIAGERRLRAAKMAGLEKIPAVFSTDNPTEIALIENLQREDLTPFEEAEAYQQMIDEYGYTQEKLAKIVGKAQNTISQTLSLNKLPEEIKSYPRVDIPKRTLYEIVRAETPKAMIDLFKNAMEGKLSAEEIREKKPNKKRGPNKTPDQIIIAKCLNLQTALTKIHPDDITTELKGDLIDALQGAKKKIDDLLYSLSS